MNEIKSDTSLSIPRLIIKVVLLLFIINFAWIYISKLPFGKISLYNSVNGGRLRFPFGENPATSYNLSLFNLDAMFASHEVNSIDFESGKNINIFLVGDSSIWGFLQRPDQTITGLLTQEFSDKYPNVSFYNLGYPSISILKDMLIIDRSIVYEPDLIIWLTTLEALPKSNQLDIPIVKNNPRIINEIIAKYGIKDISKIHINPMDFTLWNQRRNISDLLDLQIYGFLWDATGIDQDYPKTIQPAQRDFGEPLQEFHGITSDKVLADYLSLQIINETINNNPEVDFLVINEPILVSTGINSSLQYNYYYPRWAYDQYRIIMDRFTKENKISYFDFWDMIPENEFTNSAIHLSDAGEELFADKMADIIEQYIVQKGDNE